ncbi:hypothetical protein M0802_009233 [Mischocyttarus mexicanus]|nr:hypothetical protein M0802_009233 [Mischocyttarus mexicanus]
MLLWAGRKGELIDTKSLIITSSKSIEFGNTVSIDRIARICTNNIRECNDYEQSLGKESIRQNKEKEEEEEEDEDEEEGDEEKDEEELLRGGYIDLYSNDFTGYLSLVLTENRETYRLLWKPRRLRHCRRETSDAFHGTMLLVLAAFKPPSSSKQPSKQASKRAEKRQN